MLRGDTHTYMYSLHKSFAIDGAGPLPVVLFSMRQNWYFTPNYYTCLYGKLDSLHWIMWPSVPLDNRDAHPHSS